MKKLFSVIVYLLFAICSRAQEPKLMLPIGHTNRVNSGQFSPDGKKIVTASNDNTAKIWDANTGQLLIDLKGHTNSVNSARFSPDGKIIVTASEDSTTKIWDVDKGQLLGDLKELSGSVWFAEFSPNGREIVTISEDNTAKIWDVNKRRLLATLKGHTDEIKSAQYSPDGKKIVTASDDHMAKIWDATSGKLIINLKGPVEWASSAQFSPDGTKIVTTSYDTIKVWEVSTGKSIANLVDDAYGFNSAQFSQDGKQILAILNNFTLKEWDLITGKFIVNLLTPLSENITIPEYSIGEVLDCRVINENLNTYLKYRDSRFLSVFFSPDRKKIITTSGENFAKIWDAKTGGFIVDLRGHTMNINSAWYSPDGGKIITVSKDEAVKVWDANKGGPIDYLREATNSSRNAHISPDGKKIIIVYGLTAKMWDAGNGNYINDLKSDNPYIHSVFYSPDGKRIVTVFYDKTTKIWDAATGDLITTLKTVIARLFSELSIQFSPDGKKIVTNDKDSLAKIWDATTGSTIADLKGHSNFVYSAQFSRDGERIVTASRDKTAKIWDATTGRLIADLIGHTGIINSAEFSPDGKKIVTISDDNLAKIWNASSGSLIANLKGHINSVTFARFSANGKKIITASSDNTAKIWDAITGKLIADLIGHTGIVNSVEFSPDNKKIITVSEDNTAKIWDVENATLLYTFFAVDSTDYLIVDKDGRYDGTLNARKLLYFTCGTEIIELDQVKDQLWVPNLAERINKGETINAKALSELNLCGLTPEVENASTNSDEYFFKIHPRRGGLGETILFVNGIEAKRYKPGQLRKNAGDYELVIKKEELKSFFVSGKENPVTLKAYTADNAISSRGVVINEDKTKEKPAAPNLFAVMVGVSDYKGNELDLKYAAKDATDISGAIANAAKKMLNTDDGKEHVFMYNLTTGADRYLLPEKNSIKKVLEEIGKKATANDILLIFFAGHGVMSAPAGTNGEGGEKKQFYFLTADASKASSVSAVADVGISTSELIEWMKPQNIRAQKRILIFDACNSGQAINDIAGKDLAVRNDDKAQQIKVIDKLNEKSGLFILSASASNQSAYEMGRYSQGLLTYSLLKAIKQQPDILEEGKYLDISRWFNAAEKTVSDLSKETGARQEPQIVSNTNFNIGVVDEDVIAKIVLPDEKPLFAASLFMNSDEAADGDNLELSKMINLQLNEFASRGTDSRIVYVMATNAPDAFSLSGRYDLKGEEVLVRVSIKKNNETKYRFEEKGTKENLKELANGLVLKAAEWAAKNK